MERLHHLVHIVDPWTVDDQSEGEKVQSTQDTSQQLLNVKDKHVRVDSSLAPCRSILRWEDNKREHSVTLKKYK